MGTGSQSQLDPSALYGQQQQQQQRQEGLPRPAFLDMQLSPAAAHDPSMQLPLSALRQARPPAAAHKPVLLALSGAAGSAGIICH